MEKSVRHNLTRTWRSANFDAIVGQDLVVRMLKNGLYKGYFFPVYLFAGQHGCGKTSTARVFAAALNCAQLDAFRDSPKKNSVPCLKCDSCVAMRVGKHPDFIEIDAASHTGVDNVRDIIDAASLAPVMGRKRVYLIDEAHMLSKAAFNAFLKILEEPPASVVFMMATTDPEKIIETVRSRCFQLFFDPVKTTVLADYLAHVCDTEKIIYEHDALTTIAIETSGSVRDALNLVERACLASEDGVLQEVVQSLLGHVSEKDVCTVFDSICSGKAESVIRSVELCGWQTRSVTHVWKKICACINVAMRLKVGVKTEKLALFHDQIKVSIESVGLEQLTAMLDVLYRHERFFAKSTAPYDYLMTILVQLCSSQTIQSGSTSKQGSDDRQISKPAPIRQAALAVQTVKPVEVQKKTEVPADVSVGDKPWMAFLALIESMNEPVLYSVFKSAVTVGSLVQGEVKVVVPGGFAFFKDVLDKHEDDWSKCALQAYDAQVSIVISFDPNVQAGSATSSTPSTRSKPEITATVAQGNNATFKRKVVRPARAKSIETTSIDISDKDRWKLTHYILEKFPGTVRRIKEA